MSSLPGPRPGPAPLPTHPLDVPTVDECLVRIQTVRARRRGAAGWHTADREHRAAVILHALLYAGYTHGLVLADFDAAADLPGVVYDTVVLAARVDQVRP
jgi:hypothetical protein